MNTYLFLADGFEEVEALATIDLLRRGGADIKSVSCNHSLSVSGAHGIEVTADMMLSDVNDADAEMLIIPGGMPGASNIAENRVVCRLLVEHASRKGLIGAICAAPAVVLAPLGILSGKRATCYPAPAFEDVLKADGITHEPERVVQDGNIITANGPSSAFLFGLALLKALKGEDAAADVAKGILL